MISIKSFVRFSCEILFSFVLIMSVGITAFAKNSSSYGPESKKFGAGLYLGEPTGITLKGYVSKKLAIDGVAAWSFHEDAFTLIGDATYEFLDLPIKSSDVTVPFYAGAGAIVGIHRKSDHESVFGVRIPVGVAVQWMNYPIEVFAEVAPGIEMAPDTDFDLSGGVGARFYF